MDSYIFTSLILQVVNYDQPVCKSYVILLTKKTKVMIFEKGEPTYCDIFLNNVKLEVVDSFKYLEVYFFKNGNWNRTQKRLASMHRLRYITF